MPQMCYFSNKPKKSPKLWATFERNVSCQDLSKIAQSGHTDYATHQMPLFVCVGDVPFDRWQRLVETPLEEPRDRAVEVGLHAVQEVALVGVELEGGNKFHFDLQALVQSEENI